MLSFKNSSPQSGQLLIMLIVLVVIVGSIFLVGGFNYYEPKEPSGPQRLSSTDIIVQSSSSAQNSMQLETIKFCKRVPGDEPTCYPKNGGYCCPNDAWAKVICQNKKCVGVEDDGAGDFVKQYAALAGMSVCDWMENPINYPGLHEGFPVNEWCGGCDIPNGFLCWGKPVILLYPETPTLVDVEIVSSGEIYVSDPLYPAGGWKNVLANPDGSLVYEGKNYKELFYESKVKNYGTPKTGLVFRTDELSEKLPELLYKLGLNHNETEIPEFMDFWLPKLYNLNSKYIFVSLIEEEVKKKNDLVLVTPEPDTRIELIIYFKPLDKLISTEPLKFGDRPERRGFTMVEWGGTIDPD